MSVVGKIVLGLSGGFLLAGILLPGAAEILLRLYLLALAGAIVANRAWDADIPRRMTLDAYSPFTDERAARPPAEAPLAIRRRTSLLEAAGDPERAGRTPVPVRVKWAVLEEVAHRLADRRGLDLNDPRHHPRIRSLVSEATWRLVRPPLASDAPGPDSDAPRLDSDAVPPDPDALRSHSNAPPVTLDRLPSILDDLERL